MVDKDTKVDYEELKKQIEYYMSDKNLKQDEFFNGVISKSETKSVPVDLFLNCNKVKHSKASTDDILKAVENSTSVVILPDRTGVKRKSDTIPELEPKFNKKNKSNSGDDADDKASFKEQMFKYTLGKADETIKWDTIQKEVEAQHGVKVVYSRLNDGQGHFAVNKFDLTPEQKQSLLKGIKIGENDATIEECSDQDLRDFYRDHGKHLDIILERVGLKKKGKRKAHTEFVFLNQRHHNLNNLRNSFRDILQRTTDGEILKEAEHNMVLELLKYHDKYEDKSKNLKGFTTGPHPEYKNTRCFFAVKEDGSKEDFSSTKCMENIKKKFNLSD